MIRLIGRVYQCLWRNTTNRPWTYEMRALAARYPRLARWLLALGGLGLMPLQLWAVLHWSLWAGPIIVGVDFIYILGGHTFWDTPGNYHKPREYFDAHSR